MKLRRALLVTVAVAIGACGADTASLPAEFLGTWCIADGKVFTVVRVGRRSAKVPGSNPIYELYRYRIGDVAQLLAAGDASWQSDGPDGADGEFLQSTFSWLPAEMTGTGTDGPMSARVWAYSRTLATMQVPTSFSPWEFERLSMQRVDELPGRDAKTCEDGGGGKASLTVEGGDGDSGAMELVWATPLQPNGLRVQGRVHAGSSPALAWRTWGDTLIAVTRLGADGQHRWTKTVPTDADAAPPTVTAHSDGRIVASWGYSAPFTVGKHDIGSWANGERSAALGSFSGDGQLQWLRHVGGSGGTTSISATRLDSRGFLFAGLQSHADPLKIAPLDGKAPTIVATVAFAQISDKGKLKKFKRFTNPKKSLEQRVLDAAVSTTDRVVVLVSSVAQKPAVDVVCYGTCVRTVNDALEEAWAVPITPEASSAGRVAVGSDGEAVAAGTWTQYRPGATSGSASTGPGHFIIALDVNGKKRWVRSRAGRPRVDGAAILVDGTSVVALSAGGDDPPDTIAVLRALTPAGAASWTQRLAESRTAEIADIAADGDGLVVLGIARADRSRRLGDIRVPAGVFAAKLRPLL